MECSTGPQLSNSRLSVVSVRYVLDHSRRQKFRDQPNNERQSFQMRMRAWLVWFRMIGVIPYD